MIRFQDLNEFIQHIQANSRTSILPLSMVARHRGVGLPTVMRMLKDGRLEEVSIGKERFVTAESYVALVNKEKARLAEVRRLIEKAAHRGRILTYSDVMTPVDLDWQSPPDRKIIGGILGQISASSFQQNRVFISAIVHKKYGSGTKPGAGYFDLVEGITGTKLEGDEAQAVDREVKKVFALFKKA